MKIQDGGRPPFENRKYAITQSRIVRPNYIIYIYITWHRADLSASASCFTGRLPFCHPTNSVRALVDNDNA